VEGADERHRRELGGEPAHERGVRLVHVDDVVAAAAQLAAQPRIVAGEMARFETAPFIGRPTVLPSGTT